MKKYYVVGFGTDEQEGFTDYVLADDEQAAIAKVDAVRHYAKATCAFDVAELLEVSATLHKMTDEQVEKSWQDTVRFIQSSGAEGQP